MTYRPPEPGVDFPAPRLYTPRRAADRPQTLGHLTERWHRLVMRHPMLAWQRYGADVIGELDPNTGRRVYDAGLVKVPRQQGKTWWLRADMLAASRRPELELVDRKLRTPADQPWLDVVDQADERGALWLPARDPATDQHRPPPRRIVIYTAQDRGKAREQIVTELIDVNLATCAPLAGRYIPRRSNGSERITWRDTGGRLQIEASNDTAGHSLTVDDARLDEAFAHDDLTIINAIEPTMLTKPDPLILVVSTPGDGTDGLMLHYEEIAAVAVNDPDTTFAVLDWSATEDDDRTDPAVWHRVMPALGAASGITEKRVRQLLARTPPAEFDRAYLARRPTSATVAAIDVAGWAECRNLKPPLKLAGGVTIGLELDPGRTRGVVAVAGAQPGGRVGVLVDCQPGTRWMAGAVRELVHRHGLTVVDVWADRRSGLGGVIDELAHLGIDVYEVNAGDVASAAGTMFDLTSGTTGGVVHDEQPELEQAVPGSRRRPLGDGAWTYSKLESVTDVAPLAGATLAVAAHRQHFPAGVKLGGIR